MPSPASFTLKSGLVVKAAFDQSIVADFEKLHGIKVNIQWAPTTVIMDAIASGDVPDAVLVTDGALSELISKNLVETAEQAKIVESRIGIGGRSGTMFPDISTKQELISVLTNAKSICYSLGGQSGLHFGPLLGRLGIADQVNARAVLIPEGLTGEKVISGEAEFAVQQLSELLSVPGISIVGELPGDTQKVTAFSAAPLKETSAHDYVIKFIEFLKTENSSKVFQDFGLSPR